MQQELHAADSKQQKLQAEICKRVLMQAHARRMPGETEASIRLAARSYIRAPASPT